jgi:hypothetical protein
MHGTFNGLPLKNIIAITTSPEAPEFTRITLCVLGGANRKLEERLHPGGEATFILSSSEVGGRSCFWGDGHNGYEITSESQKPQSIRAAP